MALLTRNILAIITILWCVAGCDTLKSLTPKDRAQSVNFVDMYTSSLANKYKDDPRNKQVGLTAKLAEYDALLIEDSGLLVAERERNKIAHGQLEKGLLNTSAEIRAARSKLSELTGHRLKAEAAQKKVDRKKASLAKKYKADQLESEEEKVETEGEEIKLMMTIIDNELSMQRDEVAKLTEQHSRLTNEMSKVLTADPVEDWRRKMRDEIVKDYIVIADFNYTHFKNDLLAGKAQTDTIADIAELLLSTATTLTGGLTSKTNLGAASTLLKGSRSTIDKNFFAQQTMRAIVNVMEDGRQQDQLRIIERLKQPTSAYPLSQAVADVQRYENRANLFAAILDIANRTGTNALVSERELRTK